MTTSPDGVGDLTGRVAVVTGGGAGIGAATARRLAAAGASVAVLDVVPAAAEALASSLGPDALPVTCDAGDPDQVRRAMAEVAEARGRLDILVNNAALGSHTSPWELTEDEWTRVLRVSLGGYFFAAQAAGREMIKNGGGAIVNVSSIAGSSALGRGNFAYSVAKGGVNQLTRELAVEWAAAGIRVNAVAPCQVLTPGFMPLLDDPTLDGGDVGARFVAGIPLGRLAHAEDVAAAIAFLASDAAAMITGVVLPVDGGNTALNAGGTIGTAPAPTA